MGYLNSLKRMFEIGWPNAERIYRQHDASPLPCKTRDRCRKNSQDKMCIKKSRNPGNADTRRLSSERAAFSN